MIRKLSLPHLSSSEVSYDYSCDFVRVGVLPPLSGTALAPWLAPSSVYPCTRRGQAQRAPPSAETPLPRRLPCLSSRLSGLVECRASACSCPPLERGHKPAGSS